MKKQGADEPLPSRETLSQMVEAVGRDPDFRLQGAVIHLADTGNPYYAWKAVRICVEDKKEFPDWLLAYLGECAERMLSKHAKKEGRDLRKVLPWIFGFPYMFDPAQRKKGPGNSLAPEEEPNRMTFALRFAIRLEQGEQPHAALSNACNDVFAGKDADADPKTLRRWLLKEFDLKEWPKNADDWKGVAREHYRSIWVGLCDWTKSRETLT